MKKYIAALLAILLLALTAHANMSGHWLVFGTSGSAPAGCTGNGAVGDIITTSLAYADTTTKMYFSSGTATAGCVNYPHVFFNPMGSARNVTVALFNSSGELVKTQNYTSSGGSAYVWENYTLTTEHNLTAGDYYVGVQFSGGRLAYQSSLSGQYYYSIDMTLGSPANFTPGNLTASNADRAVGIVFNNTSGNPE